MSRHFKNRVRIGTLLNVAMAVIFALTAIGLGLYARNWARQLAEAEAHAKARILLDHNLAIHQYINKDLKPLLLQSKRINPAVDFEPTWMSSTYAVRRIQDYFNRLSERPYYYKESAANARTPSNEADPHERAFLDELNLKPDLISRDEMRTFDGKPYLVSLRRGESMEQPCLRCHDTPERAPKGLIDQYGPERSFGRRVGDTVSAISIRVPLVDEHDVMDRASLELIGLLFGAFLCLFVVLYFLQRRFLHRPLATIQSQAKSISEDTAALGAEIPAGPGRELFELGSAFNAMSRQLREERDRLEERVQARTAEIEALNKRLREELDHIARAEAEKKDAQAKLLHTSKLAALGTFAAGIAHEVNNPLSIIIGTLGILKASLVARNGSREDIALLERQTVAAKRIADIVSGVRTFARAEIDEHSVTSLHDAVEEVLGMTRDFYLSRGVFIQTDLRAKEHLVLGTQGRLLQVILNLMANAKDAIAETGEDGWIRIETLDRGGSVVLRISDSGPGIREEIRSRIFEPFFTTKPAGSGTGLGLSLVHSIVKEMGGDVQLVHSAQPQTGAGYAVFEITLPVADKTHESSLDRKTSKEETPCRSRRITGRALVVDDEEEIRMILVHFLTELGAACVEAENGQKALDILAKEPFDYVLTDLRMPVMNGYQFIRAARNAGIRSRFIVITGSDLGDLASSAEFAGAADQPDDYIHKPFTAEDLAEVLSKYSAPPQAAEDLLEETPKV